MNNVKKILSYFSYQKWGCDLYMHATYTRINTVCFTFLEILLPNLMVIFLGATKISCLKFGVDELVADSIALPTSNRIAICHLNVVSFVKHREVRKVFK